MMQDTLPFTILFRDQIYHLRLSNCAPLSELATRLQNAIPDVDTSTIKLLLKGGKTLRLDDDHFNRRTTIQDIGITPGAKLKLLASTKAAIRAVKNSKEDNTIPGFEYEEKRQLQRQQVGPTRASSAQLSKQLFSTFETWRYPGLTPPPSEALHLLHRLALDPGILGVMKKYGWKVGILKEMPPEGKVGISPVCILGLNVGNGREIHLRLRTDDLKGFRKYDSIRLTLIHELAHNIHSDHDNHFKALNSKLKQEVEALDWKRSSGAHAVGGAVAPAPLVSTPKKKSRVVGGADIHQGKDARAAAGAAAVQRAAAINLQSFPVDISNSPPETSPRENQIRKGDSVLYKQRDGSWTAATVVAVDLSVQPPSYGIELPVPEGEPGQVSYRETELDRLRKQEVPLRENGVEGMETNYGDEYKYTPHYDPMTDKKENDVYKLLE